MDTITIITIWLATHLGIVSVLLPILLFAALGYVAAAIANYSNKTDR